MKHRKKADWIARDVAENIVECLQRVLIERSYIDKSIRDIFKANKHWNIEQRKQVVEAVYDIVRYFRWYRTLVGGKLKGPSDLWLYLGAYLVEKKQSLPKWSEFAPIQHQQLFSKKEELLTNYPIKYSLPDWLYDFGQKTFGEQDWHDLLTELNHPSQLTLRANRLKTDVDTLQAALEKKGIKTDTLGEEGLILKQWRDVFGTSQFKEGYFEIQDGASQMVAPMLDVSPKMTVVDACAGAGGKTLHLAALMENKGRLIALDPVDYKLAELKKRAKRAGVHNIEMKVLENNKVIKRLHGKADRLLLDVPCSGFGVLKRNPDIKWRLKPDFLEKLNAIQQDILQNYSKMLKVGGKMVYTTCSIFPQENDAQVDQFLEKQEGNFELLASQKINPSDGYDGFFMALIERKS